MPSRWYGRLTRAASRSAHYPTVPAGRWTGGWNDTNRPQCGLDSYSVLVLSASARAGYAVARDVDGHAIIDAANAGNTCEGRICRWGVAVRAGGRKPATGGKGKPPAAAIAVTWARGQTGEFKLSSLLYPLYSGAMTVAEPAIRFELSRRLARGKEDADPHRRGERQGIATVARPAGPLVWLHAASVGEARAATVLIDRLLAAKAPPAVLLTTTTVSAARQVGDRLPAGRSINIYRGPARLYGAFLDHWRPDGAVARK